MRSLRRVQTRKKESFISDLDELGLNSEELEMILGDMSKSKTKKRSLGEAFVPEPS